MQDCGPWGPVDLWATPLRGFDLFIFLRCFIHICFRLRLWWSKNNNKKKKNLGFRQFAPPLPGSVTSRPPINPGSSERSDAFRWSQTEHRDIKYNIRLLKETHKQRQQEGADIFIYSHTDCVFFYALDGFRLFFRGAASLVPQQHGERGFIQACSGAWSPAAAVLSCSGQNQSE